jgi:UDP-N-acetylglucosamine 2-epimerase (non-hydrolysing)
MLKVINVVGARPNYMKIAPLCRAMKDDTFFAPILVHTGQHYGQEMSDVFFKQLGLPQPDHFLNVGSGSHAKQTAEVMVKFEDVLLKEKPGLVIVVGDVNSTLAGSLVAVKMGIPVAHIESGLRSHDRHMPEEHNRVVTDHITDLLFTTCQEADENLQKEGIAAEKIHFVGNIMIDSLRLLMDDIRASTVREPLEIHRKKYALLTLHRPSNVDDRESLARMLEMVDLVQRDIKLIFSAHPRTLKMLETFGLRQRLTNLKNLVVIDPIGYVDFVNLMMHAELVLTDSGGIQEETTVLQVPCLTLRENTERPITITEGTNILVGTKTENVLAAVRKILAGDKKQGRVPHYWDGQTAGRVVDVLKRRFGSD